MAAEDTPRTRIAFYGLAAVAAVLLGWSASHLGALVVALVVSLPIISHLRHVGIARALSEPTGVTFILVFYIFVFPLRGLVIALRDYEDVFLAPEPVSPSSLAATLVLASVATTTLLESYYYVLRRRRVRVRAEDPAARERHDFADQHAAIVKLASGLAILAFASLIGVLRHYGGLAGAQSALLDHGKDALLSGSTGSAESAWAILAAPTVWCATALVVDATSRGLTKLVFATIVLLVIVAELVVFGSRLGAALALVGVWIVVHYTGRRVPVRYVLAAIMVGILVSVPIVSARAGGADSRLPAVERYSRLTGYGVLDVSLAVRQQPDRIRTRLTDAERWLDTPSYFVPSAVWPDRPNIQARRLDLAVAQTLGTENNQATGFPASYVTEGWIYGGWLAALLLSAMFGAALGWLHCRLVGRPKPGIVAVLCYAFVVAAAFSYYKDGDLLAWALGQSRAAVYLGLALLAARLWHPAMRRGLRHDPPPATARHQSSKPSTPPRSIEPDLR